MANEESVRPMLDQVIQQRDQVLARITELEAQHEDIEVGDPAGAIAKLKESSLELMACRSVLNVLEMQIVQLRGKRRTEPSEEDRQACEALWAEERSLLDAVVLTTQLLKLHLDDLQKVQRRIRDRGGYLKAQVPLSLSQAVYGALELWRLQGAWQDEGIEAEQ
jgi:hypothetical protein